MNKSLIQKQKNSLKRVINEEIKELLKQLPWESNGFILTSDMQEVPVFMAVKSTREGLRVVFYGEDDYDIAPDKSKPYYMWYTTLSLKDSFYIENNMDNYDFTNWYDLWFDITDRIYEEPKYHWFRTEDEARRAAERIFVTYA